ncbi:MAG: hypothetical protein WAN04_12055, partial [Candidatus Udaeobacter sp.]
SCTADASTFLCRSATDELSGRKMIWGDFTNAVATGLWPVQLGAAFHTRETAHRAVATSATVLFNSL